MVLQAATSPDPRRKGRTAPSLELQPFHLDEYARIEPYKAARRKNQAEKPKRGGSTVK